MPDDFSPQRVPGTPANRFGIWLKGAFISNVAGMACMAAITIVSSQYRTEILARLPDWTSLVLVSSIFLTLPFAIGFGAAFFWKVVELTPGQRFGWTLANLMVSLTGAVVLFREGSLCLLMAPLLLLFLMWLGCEVGTKFWKKNPFLGVSLLPLLLLLMLYDASQPHFYASKVQTVMHSDLPPSKLWRYAASYPRNDAPPEWWLWRLGGPYALEVKGDARVGGRRDCQFSGGVFVGEKVVAVEEGRMIEFAVDQQPDHPEVTNHFKVTRARIELLPDGKGGTIMRGTGWYELYVYPTWYFAPWCDSALRHVHERVFLHMERLARKSQKRSKMALQSSGRISLGTRS